MWQPFEHGNTLGRPGAEGGVTVTDEAHSAGARITLEREAKSAPWAITAGVAGVFAHRAFASTETEARTKYAEMKEDLAEIVEGSGSAPCYEKIRLFTEVY